jgi:predicted DNA-binding transcriptional regulator AlpA
LYGCSAATVWRRVHDGRIPKPRKLSDRVTAWNVGELRKALHALRGAS